MKQLRILSYKLLGRHCPKFLSPYRSGWLFTSRLSYRDLEKYIEPWFFKPPKLIDDFTKNTIVEYYGNRSKHLSSAPTPFTQYMIDTGQIDKIEKDKSTRWRIYGKPNRDIEDDQI